MQTPHDNHHGPEKDDVTGVETTGHEWDGIKELNNPTPRWWLWVFIITHIWAFGYWVVYPAWPTLSGNTKGTAGWTQFEKLKAEQQEIQAVRNEYIQRFQGQGFEAVEKDPELYNFALASGEAVFKDNCATCHGTGGAGGIGYPNLTDDAWLWGGTLDEIYHTVKYGVRSGHAEARDSQMPAFGDGILDDRQIDLVANYVTSLTGGGKHTEEGAQIFQENCAVCHGEDATGNRELGAPNLRDAIWLYAGDFASIKRQVNRPRHGQMPAWGERFDDDTLRQLAIYVHSLGGGE